MSKNVLIISSSLRAGSNSEILAEQAGKGAMAAGNKVEFISLRDKEINFCKGCLACQKTLKCVISDDVTPILEKVKESDIVVFATPIYYYEMCGQLKTLLDRLNPLYPQEYGFRDIYLITASAEEGDEVIKKAISGLNGWCDCFENANFKGAFNGGGLTNAGEVKSKNDMLNAAFNFGKSL